MYSQQDRDDTAMSILILLALFIVLGAGSAVAFLGFHAETLGAMLALGSAASLLSSIVASVASRNMF